MKKDNDVQIQIADPSDPGLPLRIDDIRYYGLKAQTELETFSRTISKAYLSARNESTESLLQQTVEKLERPDNQIDLRSNKSIAKVKRYRILLQSIDELKLALQLEQVALIKEIRIYERANSQIDSCCIGLEQVLTKGEQYLSEITHNKTGTPDQSEFIEAFRRRLDDLHMSKTIAEQGRVQLALMKQNAVSLESKIRNAVLNTIPLWRNQIVLLFGIDTMKEKTKSFERLRKSTKRNGLIEGAQKKIDGLDSDLRIALHEIYSTYKAFQNSAQMATNTSNNSIKEGGSGNGRKEE